MTMTEDRLALDLADKMRKAMRVAELDMVSVARRMDVTRETVSRWINGRTVPRRRDLRLFAEATGVEEAWFHREPAIDDAVEALRGVGELEAQVAALEAATGMSFDEIRALVRPEGLEPPTF